MEFRPTFMMCEPMPGSSGFPLVSICMPAYNHAKFVVRALESAMQDPYPNKEIIIVDDGSTDGTPDMVERWAAEHRGSIELRLFKVRHGGVARALNRAIAEARGDFCALLASDDELVPGGIEVRVRLLQSQPAKRVAFADAEVIDADGAVIWPSAFKDMRHRDTRAFATVRGVQQEFIRHWSMPGSVAMFRKVQGESEIPFDPSLSLEDWDFFLRFAATGEVAYADSLVTRYRVHSGNEHMVREHRLQQLMDARRTALKTSGLFGMAGRVALLGFALKCSVSIVLEPVRRILGINSFKESYVKWLRRLMGRST